MEYQGDRIVSRLNLETTAFLELAPVAGGPQRWVEVDPLGAKKFEFVEVQRDGQTVTVSDASRNILVRLPQQGGRIFFSFDNKQWGYLGSTTSVLP